MLIEFSVGNYRSFHKPVTLSLEATKLTSQDKSLDEDTIFTVDDNLRLLTSAAVYGANASGKSNLASAMKFMRTFVLNSSKDMQAGEKIATEPFALIQETVKKPSYFEIIFIANERQYRYGFELTTERIEREWLYHVPGKRETPLFTREGQNITIAKTAFKEGKGLGTKTRSNALFLSVVAQFNGPLAEALIHWFSLWEIISGLDDDPIRYYTDVLLKHPVASRVVIDFIKSVDAGIDDLQISEVGTNEDGGIADSVGILGRTTIRPAITTIHHSHTTEGELASPVSFDPDKQESEGTKKIIAFAGLMLTTLRAGLPLVIDEFDARLHPIISREIVRLFNSPKTNPRHAQLVFLTHDSNLLDRKLLRRDQIWFVEKDRIGASHLYSLAEFKVRYDASYEQDYIRGKYGAIPFLGDVRRVVESINA